MIRTRLIFAAALPAALTAVIAVVIHVAATDVRVANEQGQLGRSIARDILHLNVLSYEYMMEPSERVARDWEAIYGDLQTNLSRVRPTDANENVTVERLRESLSSVNRVFQRVIQILGTEREDAPGTMRRERLVGQLQVRSTEAETHANHLSQSELEDARKTRDRADEMVTACLVLLAVVSVLSAWTIGRNVLRPLTDLHEGVEEITSGNLHHQVQVGRKDEFGFLATSFNRMAGRLNSSRDALEDEIVERREAHRATLESERRLSLALSTSGGGTWIFDTVTGQVEPDEYLARMFGVDSENDGSRYTCWLRRIHPEDRGAVLRVARAAVRDGTPVDVTHRVVHPNGEEIVVRTRAVQEIDSDGERTRLVGVCVDVTQEKVYEQALEDANRELEVRVQERTKELETALNDAKAASRAKSQFLANMSHELRTPLNAVLGYAEMLQLLTARAGHDDYHSDLKKIQSAGEHLLSLINDVLDIAKVEAGRMTVDVAVLDVRALVEEVVATLAPLAAENGNRLRTELEGDLGAMRTDSTKLRQILINLLGNACKFTEHGDVCLRVRNAGREIVFEVSDNGPGIEREKLDRLFEPFVQGDASSTRRHEGTGLGLALSRRFVELLGGRIEAESEPGSGATFRVFLRAGVGGGNRLPVTVPTVVPPGLRSEPRILVIDDDLQARELMSRLLAEEGYDVVCAASGPEGIRLAAEVRPDLITLDVLLPDLDGWEVLSRLKADPHLQEIPIVVVSIIDQTDLAVSLGAADYIVKPVRRNQLLQVVGRLQPADGPREVLVVEDDQDTRALIARTLKDAGWRVWEAGNGREGLSCVEAHSPPLVVLDLMMPEVDGFDFLEGLRAVDPNPAVVVVTAKDLTEEERGFLDTRALAVLEKGKHPVGVVLAEIRRYLERAVA